MRYSLALVTGLVGLLCFCAPSCRPCAADIPREAHQLWDSTGKQWADSVLGTLTLREKVAQSFMVSAYSRGAQEEEEGVLSLVEKEKVGGLIFFQGTAQHEAKLTNRYQEAAEVPLLIGIDGEWGLGMRLEEALSYPKSMAFAATGSPQLAYRMGDGMAHCMRRLGIHINFAPVIDVNSNPSNPVIGIRSFGDSVEQVAAFGTAYMLGMLQNGVLPCAKHFPGHGNTSTDSHHALPFIPESASSLEGRELAPFRELIGMGVPMIMVAHIDVPALGTKKGEPASLSHAVTTGWLRQRLGFKGLIVTDGLNMAGARGKKSAAEVNLKAYKAGADILLCPEEVGKSIHLIAKAVKKGEITEGHVDSTCRRILEAKYWAIGPRARTVKEEGLPEAIRTEADRVLVEEVANESVTVLEAKGIPLSESDIENVGYVSFLPRGGVPFADAMRPYTMATRTPVNLGDKKQSVEEAAKHAVGQHTSMIICVRAGGYYPSNQFGVKPEVVAFAKECAKLRKTVLAVFGTPYALAYFAPLAQFDGVVLAYGEGPEMQHAAAQVIFGAGRAHGVLPVSVPPELKRGAGIEITPMVRLRLSSAHEVGADPHWIHVADSLAKVAVDSLAMPGLQVIAAVKGSVFYHKNFGKTRYDSSGEPVTDSTLYDLASLTKVMSTTPVIMALCEKKKSRLMGG